MRAGAGEVSQVTCVRGERSRVMMLQCCSCELSSAVLLSPVASTKNTRLNSTSPSHQPLSTQQHESSSTDTAKREGEGVYSSTAPASSTARGAVTRWKAQLMRWITGLLISHFVLCRRSVSGLSRLRLGQRGLCCLGRLGLLGRSGLGRLGRLRCGGGDGGGVGCGCFDDRLNCLRRLGRLGCGDGGGSGLGGGGEDGVGGCGCVALGLGVGLGRAA